MSVEDVLCVAHSQLQLWNKSQEKAILHLSSLSNLTEQAETLNCCIDKPTKLGVLSQQPLAVHLLEAKLIHAMERALSFVAREREVLSDVVAQLKKCSKEGQLKFKHIAGGQGMEVACTRTPESFSPCDHASWLRLIHAAYKSNLEEKRTSLEKIVYTSDSVGEIVRVWRREPEEIRGVLALFSYAVTRKMSVL